MFQWKMLIFPLLSFSLLSFRPPLLLEHDAGLDEHRFEAVWMVPCI